jgi:hypothetical protein
MRVKPRLSCFFRSNEKSVVRRVASLLFVRPVGAARPLARSSVEGLMMKRLSAIATMILTLAFVAAAQTPAAKDQITEITLERTGCFGTCPIYKVTLRRDGTISYNGKQYVQLKGAYEGRAYGFDRMAQLILASGYFKLKDNYTANATDLPSAVTSVVANGKRKTIENYGDFGPVELWGIEMAIDGILRGATLEKTKEPQVVSPRK